MSDRDGRGYNRSGNNRGNYSGGSRRNYQGNRSSGGGRGGRGGYNKKRSGPREFYLPRGTIIYTLDVLSHGYLNQMRGGASPIIQAIETPGFNLFEMYFKKETEVMVQERIELKGTPESRIGKVKKRLKYHGLTQTSKDLLSSTIDLHVSESEDIYLKFLNNCGSITKKRHQLNLLPGIGEKSMWEIINTRNRKFFESFEDFQERVKSVKDIKALLVKRILNEIIDDEEKHLLFVKRRKPKKSTYKKSSSNYGSRSRNPYGGSPSRRY